jgi:hypothetical protein
MGEISKTDRNELASIVRLRMRVAKAAVAQREAELLAKVEEELSAIYKADSAAWAAITKEADRLVREADAEIARICREQGIPEEFRPGLGLGWYGRGVNAEASRRAELRALAKARIDAAGKAAKTAIEARSAEVLTELIAGGLESEAARAFIASIPTVEQLMPPLAVAELEAKR